MYRATSSLLKLDDNNTLKSIFMKRCDFDKPQINNKVTIVGLSPVSKAIILTLSNDQIFGKICCFDLDGTKVQNELSELIVKAPTRFLCGSNYELTADSDVIVIAFDFKFKQNEPLTDMATPCAKLLKETIPKIAALNPNAIYLNANRPNNVLTYIIQKLSNAPKHKVIGIGTYPETFKLQYHLAEILNLSPTSILLHTIGSRCNPVTLWDSVSTGGVLIKDIFTSEAACEELLNNIRNRRDKLAKSSNYLDWTCAFCIWLVLISILVNRAVLISLSCDAKDVYGIKEETFLSLPCCLSRNGIAYVVKPKISEKNKQKIRKIVDIQLAAQKQLGY